jgi:hypothetical protein
MTCSGVCRRRVPIRDQPSQPHSGASDSHKRWTCSRGPSQSDGYPVIGPTLAESESTLARLIGLDPWCVKELAGTKGVLEGQVSFDDRAYLRILI